MGLALADDTVGRLKNSEKSRSRKESKSQPSQCQAAVDLALRADSAELVTVDGRLCVLCGFADNSPDPVFSSQHRKWGYAARTGKQQGRHCYYCVRVFESCYKCNMSISALVTLVGSDPAEMHTFRGLLELCVNHVSEMGTTGGSLNWTAFEQQVSLSTTKRKELSMVDPEDLFYPTKDYESKFGDVRSNGLGHNKCTIVGIEGVRVPGEIQDSPQD